MGFNLCGWIPKPLLEALQKRLNLLVVQGLTGLPKLGKENLFHKNCGIISVKVVKMIEKDVVKYEMKNKKYQAYQEPPSTLGPDRMSARDVAETCFRILLESSLVLTSGIIFLNVRSFVCGTMTVLTPAVLEPSVIFEIPH